jgi:hypothetical protein
MLVKDKACDLLRKVSRSLVAPPDEVREAEERLKIYEALPGP